MCNVVIRLNHRALWLHPAKVPLPFCVPECVRAHSFASVVPRWLPCVQLPARARLAALASFGLRVCSAHRSIERFKADVVEFRQVPALCELGSVRRCARSGWKGRIVGGLS
eukprot:6180879-Pleurochrysis_carterae.AAC.2